MVLMGSRLRSDVAFTFDKRVSLGSVCIPLKYRGG